MYQEVPVAVSALQEAKAVDMSASYALMGNSKVFRQVLVALLVQQANRLWLDPQVPQIASHGVCGKSLIGRRLI